MTHCHRRRPLPEVKTQDGSGRCPQPWGWWQQKLWSYGIKAYSQRSGQWPLVDWWTDWHPCLQASFDRLIHLLWSQFAYILGYLRVQNVSDFFVDSVQGNLVLEGLKLFVCQFILPIFTQVAHGGTYPYQKVYGSLLRLLVKILYSIPLLPEGEGPTIVFPQHLEESS